jgi:hypothetical protein
VDQHFRVGFTLELIAQSFQIVSETPKVVDGAIEYNSNQAIGGQHRLTSGFAEVEYCKSLMSQRRFVPHFDSLAVRPTASKHANHSADHGRRRSLLKVSGDSSNSTHTLNLNLCSASGDPIASLGQ